jgi:N-acetyl-anhydromuramyl-L-alanine amidase AmpD
MINIIKKPCSNWNERDGFVPEIIAIHIADGSLESMDSWFAFKGSMVSAHYGISYDGKEIHQYIDESKAAWACGIANKPTFKLYKPNVNPNKYMISIENAGTNLAKSFPIQIETLCELIKDVAKRNNIPLDRDHIIGHFEVNPIGKPVCPSPDHSVMDRLVASLTMSDEICVMCPRSRVDLVKQIISNFK